MGDPGAERRVSLLDPPAVHLQHRRTMGERVHVERLDHRQLVHVLRDVRERVRAPQTGLPVLLELALRSEHLQPLGLIAPPLDIDLLAVVLLEFGLVVEQIHVRRTAIEIEEDAGLGLGGEVLWPRGERVHQSGRRHRAKNLCPRKDSGQGDARHRSAEALEEGSAGLGVQMFRINRHR